MKEGKRVFALIAVALMLLVSISVMVPAESEAASSTVMPTMKDYAYVFKYNTSTGAITGVWQNENITEANISGDTNKATAASTSSVGSWGFTNGLGPFNSFYAAINTSTSADTGRMNTGVGQIAFILNPNDLTKTLDNTAWTMANYNIMFVIPTVYWYSDTTKGIMYMSNTDNNPYIAAYDSSANAKMFPYAHNMTATSTSGSPPTGGHTYPYLAIGVYEATLDETKELLQSKSGSTPAASTKLATFSTYAKNNNNSDMATASVDTTLDGKVGQYGLWNFYGWTLYKIMSETVIGSRNAQAAIGQGNAPVSNAYSYDTATNIAASTAGQGNTAGPYANNVDANRGTTVYSKLFIENSWGSVWEFVDNTWVGTSTLHAGSNLSPEESDDSHMKIKGKDYTGEDMTIPTGNDVSISNQSIKSSAWGAVSTSSPSTTSSVSGDKYYSTNDVTRCLIVGGCWLNGASAGLSAWSSNYDLSSTRTLFGSRLAYMMTADAAGPAHTVSVASVEHGTTTASVTSAVAGELISFENDPTSGYRLKDVTITYPTSQTVTPSYKTLVRGAFTMPAGNVTITPEYEAVTDLSATAGSNGSITVTYGGETAESPVTLLSSATYTVTGSRGASTATLSVTDVVLGENISYLVTATPSTDYFFEKFTGGDSATLSTGTVASISGAAITANFFQYSWSLAVTGGNGSIAINSETAGTSAVNASLTIDVNPNDGYRLKTISGINTPASGDPYATEIVAGLTASTFSMPEADVSITAVFEATSTITVSAEDLKGSISISGSQTESPLTVYSGASYSVIGRTLQIQDVVLGVISPIYIVAIPESGFSFDVFKDQSANELSTGTVSGINSITAYFMVGGSQYSVIFYESASRSTSVAVDKGYSVMLPDVMPVSGKEFKGWYSDSETTSYVGPSGSYYTPTGSTLAITLYAGWDDLTSYTISYTYTLDGETSDYASVNAKCSALTVPTTITEGSTGYIIAKPLAGYSISLSATGVFMEQMEGDIYKMVPIDNADSVAVTVACSEIHQGIGDFRISYLAYGNTKAGVHLEAASSGGLIEGTVQLMGTYYTTSGEGSSAVRAYASIEALNLTTSVDTGDMKVDWEADLSSKSIYSVYAKYTYTLDGTNTVMCPAQYGV